MRLQHKHVSCMLTDMTELFKCVHLGYAYLDPEVVNIMLTMFIKQFFLTK